MNTKYPKLRRPHRKLNFLPNKERSSTQWGGKVTLEDVDRLFDDLESSSDDFESIIPLSPMPKTTSGAKEEEAMENKKSSPVHLEAPSMGNVQQSSIGLKGQFQQPAEPVENTSQNLVPLETTSPFAKHGPIKTSSPLEGTHVEEKVAAFSPILFLCGDDDDVPEEPKAASLSIEKTRSQGPVQPSSEDVSEALPNVFSFSKDKSLKDVGDVEKRPEPPLPSTAGPSQPAAVKSPPARKEHASSFLQKLRQTGHSKSPWKSLSPVKEPLLPEEPAQEPEEDFLILEEDTPAWFTISRKKDKHRPTQQTTNNNNNDGQLTSDQRLEHGQAEKAETQDTGHGGESANLEEGRAVNKKKKKKKKASIPSLPSPKRRAVKTMTKGTKIAMETAVPAPSTDSDLMDQGEDHEKERKKKGRKKVTEERRPSPPSMPQGQTPHHTSPSQAVQLQTSGTVASKKQSSSSVVRKSRPTKVNQEEKTKRMKAGKSVKGRRKEEMLSSESLPSKTPEEQSRNNETEHSNMGPANTPLSSCEEAGLPGQAHGKRRRKPPGDWWLSLSSSTEKPDGPPALKAPRQDPKRPQAAAAQSLSAKTTQNGGPKETTRRKKAKRGGVAGVMEEEELQHVSDQVLEPVAHSPEDLSSRLERLTPAKSLFDRTYTRHKGPPEPEKGAPDAKRNRRTRKPPGNWWKPSDAGDADADPPLPPQPPLPPPQPRSQKARKGPKQQAKRRKSLKPVAAKTITAQPLSTPPGVTSIPSSAGSTPYKRKKMFAAPKTIKRSLAKFQDIFNRTPEVSPPDAVQNAAREEPTGRKKRLLAPLREQYTGGEDDADMSDDLQDGGPNFVVEAPADSSSRRPSWPSSIAPPQCNKRLSDSTLKGFQSGPSSLIILEQHEEDAEMLLPSSRTQRSAWLSLGLHAPPLVPLVLQEEDEANLKDWLSMVWHVPNQAESSQVGPEDFDWFCHRGQAIGLQVDMCSESLCNGKILLGSYMKKPLWVDHSATTVFYVSTSCVAVTVDTTDFNYSAGQSFVVPCGHAYSIKNREDEPALMFFCWVPADGPE